MAGTEFWKSKFPNSWPIAKAMQTRLKERVSEEAASDFWRQLSGVFPEIGHFAQFFAESLASSGKVLEAVNIWKTWLDRLLEEGESHSFSEFTVEAIVIELDKFFKTGDLAKAVEF